MFRPLRSIFSSHWILAGLRSTEVLIQRGEDWKDLCKIQVVLWRCQSVMCLMLGMFWMISTQVLPALNFQWNGVHPKCLITAALAASRMSGPLVSSWPTCPWLCTVEEACTAFENYFSFSRCVNVGGVHWGQDALWKKHQLWSGNHGYPWPPTLPAQVGIQIHLWCDAEMLARGMVFSLCFLVESLRHLRIGFVRWVMSSPSRLDVVVHLWQGLQVLGRKAILSTKFWVMGRIPWRNGKC